MVKALLFDFDGTIVDTESVDLRSWEEVFSEHGAPLPWETFQLRIGTLTGPDELEALEAAIGRTVDRVAVQERRRARERELFLLEPVRDGIAEWLAEARELGLRLGVVSSASYRWVNGGLDHLGITEGWDCVICADGDRERCKPSPALYLEALDLLDLEPGEAVVIEDSPNGVAAAVAAGIYCVAVPNPVTAVLDFDEADLVLGSLADLPLRDLLARL